jgi:MoxR-like ATPase
MPKPKEQIDVRTKFECTREEMKEALIERDDEIDMVLTALLCSEHPLLVGPPGTAKSLLLDTLFKWFHVNEGKFNALIGKYTTPEDLFGPISVIGLKEDKYRRVTAGMLPWAKFAFLDEIFKGNTGILNTLLRVLNERVFNYDGDGVWTKVPLEICVAASNEWPNDQEGGKELGALFDRFLFRKSVRPISSPVGRRKLLWTRDHEAELTTTMTSEELKQARKQVACIRIPEDVQQAFEEIVTELGREGIRPGDRRQYKAVRAVQAYAWLTGDGSIAEKDHLEVLQWVLWDDPIEQPEKCAKIVARIAAPVRFAIIDKMVQAQNVLDKSSAEDAVPKLREIKAQIEAMGEHPKKKAAVRQVSQMIKDAYDKVIGREHMETVF